MRMYVMITGALFGLITIAHLLRMVLENPHLVSDPIYLLLTVFSAGLAGWAWRLLRSQRKA